MARSCDARELAVFPTPLSSNQAEVASWRRISRQVFIPCAYRWLFDLASDRYPQPETGLVFPNGVLSSLV